MSSFRYIFFTLLLFLLVTQPADARHSQVDRGDLDDEIVEEFPIPVLFGVEKAGLVPDFGDSRGGGTRLHEGQDMRAPLGTPIVSPTEAIVLSTGVGPSAGKFVYTANPGGETFRYMHLDMIADLKRGDELDVGDFIGTVGDTGNAPDGVYHLHLEVRDENNKPTDPFERFDEDSFSVKKKMSFLRSILREVDDDDEYAEFLVETYPGDFQVAMEKNYRLPSEIEAVLEDSGATEKAKLLSQLDALIRSIPTMIRFSLREGDNGVEVLLVQTYLIYTTKGQARDRLAAAGATGYYGSITTAAFREYQAQNRLKETGVFDELTRARMIK